MHACGLTSLNTSRCWGDNLWGQTDVPVDDKTEPPAFLHYSTPPGDVDKSSPNLRWNKYHHTVHQHIHFALYIPEFALADTLKVVFLAVCDLDSPHEVYFAQPEFDIPGTHVVNISAYDLTQWHDLNWGRHPKVRFVQSQNGGAPRLKHNCEYEVALSYQDTLGHAPGVHYLTHWNMEFDYVTLAPVVRFPVSNSVTKQDLQFEYDLLEDMYTDSVKITISHTAGTADPNAPHILLMKNNATFAGAYKFQFNLLDLHTYLPWNTTNDLVQWTTV